MIKNQSLVACENGSIARRLGELPLCESDKRLTHYCYFYEFQKYHHLTVRISKTPALDHLLEFHLKDKGNYEMVEVLMADEDTIDKMMFLMVCFS